MTRPQRRHVTLALSALLAVFAGQSTIAWAQAGAAASPAAAERTDGEVRKIDRAAARLTLKHEDIRSLGMPAMTMVFQVRDPALFEGLEVGTRVRFLAEKLEGAYVITALQRLP